MNVMRKEERERNYWEKRRSMLPSTPIEWRRADHSIRGGNVLLSFHTTADTFKRYAPHPCASSPLSPL